ncbi:MAG TPA: zinc ABC transporter substrate-binding protein, partial [Capillimicrobium sp.]
ALLVVPAATARLLVDRVRPWQAATVALAALEGTFGLWLSVQTDAPPGATIAVVAGAVFALVAVARWLGARRGAALAAAGAAVVIAGCGSGAGGSGDGVAVVASTPVVADIVREVGGEHVDVTQLLEANSDPHDYEPRPSDVADAAEAQVVVESGLGLDEWVHEVVEQSGGDATVVDLGASVAEPLHAGEEEAHAEDEHAAEEEGDEHAHDHGDTDPHWWHDPTNAVAAASAVADALAEADPDHADAYRANAEAYTAELEEADAAIERCVASVPEAQRVLVTDHDALGYFAHRYGVEVVGAIIPSLTTQAQASAGDLAELVETIRERDVPAVFPASSVNRRLADTVAEQTGATVGEPLYADTLGPEGSDGATLLGATRHNAEAIVSGLTGGRERCGAAGA